MYDNFEKITLGIFSNSGYEAQKCDQKAFDIIAKKENVVYYVEVKSYTSLHYRRLSLIERSIVNLVNEAEKDNARPVLFVYSLIDESDKQKYMEEYSNLIIIDLQNILFSLKSTELQDELISILPFSVESIEPINYDEQAKYPLNLNCLMHSDITTELMKRLNDCVAGMKGAFEFEDICFDLLKYVFSDDLSLWKKQAKSNDGLFRFDLLCRIKDNNSKTFWSMVEKFFNSKYVVFEYKNYSKEIKQNQIYTTERYLYRKALRSVAIIIAKNGYDEHAQWAAKGSLRENGKLIIIITVENMKKMYKLKVDQSDPSEVLLEILDRMLEELEK